jgi:hypothetical protein
MMAGPNKKIRVSNEVFYELLQENEYGDISESGYSSDSETNMKILSGCEQMMKQKMSVRAGACRLTYGQIHVQDDHIIFFYLVCEAIGTVATPGLLCQPRVIVKMNVEKQMECRLARETEVLGENLPQRHFCPSQNPT